MKLVVLLSGGMDSTTLATLVQSQHPQAEIHAIIFHYGQKHSVEISCAADVAEHLDLDNYELININGVFRNSALLAGGPDIDDKQDKASVGATFVPARNSVLLSIAAGYADAIGATTVYYGAHAEDHAGYPDCRPEYFAAINNALQLGTVNGVSVAAPFIDKNKSDIVKMAAYLKAPLELTHSCYRGTQPQCGTCPTCDLRINAFKEAGWIDPVSYAKEIDWQSCEPFPSQL